jgi:hypothetical protein
MGVPAIEIVFTNVGKHTIEDESTKDGADWLEAFRSGAQIIPGCIRAGWGVSDRDSQVVMHFIGKMSWGPCLVTLLIKLLSFLS